MDIGGNEVAGAKVPIPPLAEDNSSDDELADSDYDTSEKFVYNYLRANELM